MTERKEFGAVRSSCSCEVCVRICRFIPGFLIPADLDRMLEGVSDPFQWAEKNLLASPGATVRDSSTGQTFRIKTLVPAVKPDGSCIQLTADGLCEIHSNAPFGCAFFSCRTKKEDTSLSRKGLLQCLDFFEAGLYGMVWRRLWAAGKRQQEPAVLRERMGKEIENESQ